MDMINKKIAILGLGQENIALVRYLIKIGANNICICDKKAKDEFTNIDDIKNAVSKWQSGSDYLSNLQDFDLIFRTPGLHYLSPEIQSAKNAGAEISSQTKLFFDLCPAKIIGVTGTKGKGTTSTLIYDILNHDPVKSDDHGASNGQQIYLAGNIGKAPIEFINELKSEDIVVLELSSFQLQDMEKSPQISVVLNVTEDHLDVHHNRAEYIEAKKNIVRHQTKSDFSVINADYMTSIEFALETKAQVFWFSRQKSIDQGVWVKNKSEIVLQTNSVEQKIIDVKDIVLRGEHNWENICAAALASYLAGAQINVIAQTIKEFKGLEHRLELVRELNGVKFYNDSFSTNPDTTIAAIKSFTEPIILIVGGSEKNADYQAVGRELSKSSVKTVIAIGVTGPRIVTQITSPDIEIISDCKNIEEVVKTAFEKAKPGDIVLLSPASASFGWFANYKERGQKFKEQVNSLK